MERFENNYTSYSDEYNDLNLFKESSGVTLVKGILGAVVVAIPGFLLWLLIARLGYVSAYCGLLIAAGSVYGYSFMTKKGDLSPAIGFVICTLVLVVSVIIAVRVDWAWEFAKFFDEEIYPEFLSEMQGYGLFTNAEIEEAYKESLKELYGFEEATFANCFKNLSTLVEYADAKFDYTMDYVISGACGLFGAGVTYTKFIKK